MDNKEFDHLMGEKLRPEQSFDFREPDWNDLSQQLDDHDRKKRIVPFWFWKSMFAIAALGTIFFLWTQLEKTKKSLQILQSNSIENNVTITDTIYKKVTITEYDTIRKSIILNEVKKRNESDKKGNIKSEKKNLNTFVKEKQQDRNVIISESEEDCDCEKDLLINEEKPLQFILAKNEISIALPIVDGLKQKLKQYERISIRSQSIGLLKTKERESILPEYQDLPLTSIQKILRKKRFSIGLLGLGLLPENQTIPEYTPDGFFNLSSKGLGLRTEFMLTNNISLTGDIIAQKINFKTNNTSFVQNLLIEEEVPTGIDTLKVNQSNGNYAFGVKYFLRKHRKIQAYTSVKLQMVSKVKQIISRRVSGGIYLEPEWIESIKKKSAIDLQSIETALGFQYRFLSFLSWQMEGNYYFYLDEKDDLLLPNVGFKTSLLFHF